MRPQTVFRDLLDELFHMFKKYNSCIAKYKIFYYKFRSLIFCKYAISVISDEYFQFRSFELILFFIWFARSRACQATFSAVCGTLFWLASELVNPWRRDFCPFCVTSSGQLGPVSLKIAKKIGKMEIFCLVQFLNLIFKSKTDHDSESIV